MYWLWPAGGFWKKNVSFPYADVVGTDTATYVDAFPTRVTLISPLRILPNGNMAAGASLEIKPIRVELQ